MAHGKASNAVSIVPNRKLPQTQVGPALANDGFDGEPHGFLSRTTTQARPEGSVPTIMMSFSVGMRFYQSSLTQK